MSRYPELGDTKPLRLPLKLHSHVLHMMEQYESLCVTHGIENVLHMTGYIEDKLSASVDRLQET